MKEFYTRIFRSQVFLFAFLLIGSASYAQLTITVTSTADSGPGTLREAIETINANPAPPAGNYINFDFSPGTAPFIITLASPLPAITKTIFFNGYSEPSSAEGAIGARTISVQIDGGGFPNPIFDVQSDLCNFAGLSLVNSGGHGISFADYTNGHRVWGCYFGVAADGVTSTGTAIAGSGIYLGYSPGAQGQFGRSIIGTQDLGYDEGATRANEGNVFGNCATGIESLGQQNIRIRGNWVGIAADGTTAVPITGAGILLNSYTIGGVVGASPDDTLSTFLTNYVGNAVEGITVRDIAKFNLVSGNVIGNTPAGATAAISGSGMSLENTHNNSIVGNTIEHAVEGILIWNNVTASITAGGDTSASVSNSIIANTIDSNFVGIKFSNFSATVPVTKNIIGNDGIGNNAVFEGNTITNSSSGSGLIIDDASGGPITLNRISANSFENNNGSGGPGVSIALNSTNTLNPINCASPTTGPNQNLNRPVIDSVQVIGTNLHIKGWVNAGLTMDFYVTTGATTFGYADRPFGELTTYLFSATEGTPGIDFGGGTSLSESDGVGGTCTLNNFEFVVPLASVPGFTVGANVAAIAMDAAVGPANTSDFSALVLSVLPVTYLSFTGQVANNVVNLKWQTATESNSSHFDVQRSADGSNFVTIGTVSAAGNSQITQNYGFTDAAPLKSAVSYYRLKQVDLDTKFEYSKTILVKSSGSNNRFVISPNPVVSNLVINLVSDVKETVSIRLIDQSGRIVKSINQNLTNGANQVRLNDLSTLPSGVYVLQIAGKSTLINEKIMKQ
ncbi:T9SS type A sorting domain-containing protein [Pollutibacter soli]|uniref:T9SS type A sorting domain-containing protein n=1 Tax=Pollutibacter soli TaxID=3034157 RepID=UPI0030136D46